MAIEVFNRYEKKYMLDAMDFRICQDYLSGFMRPDQYNQDNKPYVIANLYYDTDDSYFIQTSVSKPLFKEKLRLRAYGIPNADSFVYIEEKKKFNGIVGKRRSQARLDEAYEFMDKGWVSDMRPYMNRQVLNEISYILSRYRLKPAVYIAYDRIAYFAEESSDLRISFDFNIRTRRTDLGLEMGDHGAALWEQDKCLMEIKAQAGMPFWLTSFLSSFKIYPISHSKYGEEFKHYIKNPQDRICV